MAEAIEDRPGDRPRSQQQRERALRAMTLLGRWRKVAGSHVGLIPCISCTCSVSFSGIPMGQLESDLIEYLEGKHSTSSMVQGLLRGCIEPETSSHGVAGLLRAITQAPLGAAEVHLSILLEDIERWLSGIEKFSR